MALKRQTIWLVVKVELEIDTDIMAGDLCLSTQEVDAYDIDDFADMFVGNCDYEFTYTGSAPKIESGVNIIGTTIEACETSCPI